MFLSSKNKQESPKKGNSIWNVICVDYFKEWGSFFNWIYKAGVLYKQKESLWNIFCFKFQ